MAERPNILFLFSDQHRPDAMSCAGNLAINTPHMDRLAQEGVRASSAYCPTPLCQPTRIAMLTGRYGHNTGIIDNSGFLLPNEPTVPQALQTAGYRTCFTGKLHLPWGGSGSRDQQVKEMGFEDRLHTTGKAYAVVGGNKEDRYLNYLNERGVYHRFERDYLERILEKPSWYAAPSVLDEEDFHDIYISRIKQEWLESYTDDRPFFCWCNWVGPHAPWDAPGHYATLYDPADVDVPIEDTMEQAPEALRNRRVKNLPPEAWRACKAHYYGNTNVIDDGIGGCLETLEEKGLLDNTVVIYASDHGEMLFDHGLIQKTYMYEASAGVPLIVRWSEKFRQGIEIEAHVSLLDLIPTFLELAGAEMEMLHGTSLIPVLTGGGELNRDTVFSEMRDTKMARTGDWKYVFDPNWERQQLFNLKDDSQEINNLSGKPEYAAIETDLQQRILNWMIATQVRPNSGKPSRENVKRLNETAQQQLEANRRRDL